MEKRKNMVEKFSWKRKAILLLCVAAFGLAACSPVLSSTPNPVEQRYATQLAELPTSFNSIQNIWTVDDSIGYVPEDQHQAEIVWGKSPITNEPEVVEIYDPIATHPCNSDTPLKQSTESIQNADIRQQFCQLLEKAGTLQFIPQERLSDFVLDNAKHSTITDYETAKIICRQEAQGCYLQKADHMIFPDLYFNDIQTITHESAHRSLQILFGKKYLPNEDACVRSEEGRISIIMKSTDYPNYPFPVDENNTDYVMLSLDPEMLPTLFEELVRIQIGGEMSPYLTNASPEVLDFLRIVNQKMIENPSARLPGTLLPEKPFDKSSVLIDNFMAALDVLFDGKGALGLVELDQNFRSANDGLINPSISEKTAQEACQ